MDILNINNLNFTYSVYNEGGAKPAAGPAIKNLSLSVAEGSIVTICGPTGCGKSTLLKLIKQEIAPEGSLTGEMSFAGKKLSILPPKEQAEKIALLFQNPEDQIVTDKVWHEIAFGLENLGYKRSDTENRIAEILSFFRLESISDENTASLSGGQKQLVLLASLLAISPKLLLLDEPISQLDPEAAEIFLSTLKRLHDQLGITMIIAEHKIESLLPITDKLVLMNKGEIIAQGNPEEVLPAVRKLLPPIDINVRFRRKPGEGNGPEPENSGSSAASEQSKPALSLRDVYFRYDKNSKDVIRCLSSEFMPGKCYGIFGCNAAGKTTLLNLISGLCKPQEGKISYSVRKPSISYLPQNVDLLFVGNTIRSDLALVGLKPENYPNYVNSFCPDSSPYDLSGGEKQLLALAKITASSPDIILLDEPTKGLDPNMARVMLEELNRFTKNGKTVIMSTHDLTFAYAAADYCSIMSMGRLTAFKPAEEFFRQNKLYSI